MGQSAQPNDSLAVLNSINTPVTFRTTSWLDLAQRAWGSEFHAPDHGIYEFSNGRKFDSTDMSQNGLYGGYYPNSLVMDEPTNYTDMRRRALVDDNGNPLFTE